MWCMKCNRQLHECTCPDLKERLERIAQCPNVLISKERMKAYEKQAKLNKEEQTHNE